MSMVTDPARIRKDDKGHPEVCSVYAFHKVFNAEEWDEIGASCRAGTIGCVACKKKLQEKLLAFHRPIHEKRKQLLENRDDLRRVIRAGSDKARQKAAETMIDVRRAMHLGL